MRGVVATELKSYLTSPPRGEKAQGQDGAGEGRERLADRIAARTHRETQRRKSALESSAMPSKLADCRSSDNDRSELFIVEGDSALGTAKPRPGLGVSRRCCRSAARS